MRKPRRHGRRPDVSIVLHALDEKGVDTGEWTTFVLTDSEFRQMQRLASARGMDVGEYLRFRIMSGIADTRRERAMAILSEKLRRSREHNTSSRS